MSAAADDGGITRLAYVQARACVMMDLWPCPLEDAALLGFRLNDPHASAASDYLAIVETWDSFGTVAFSGYVLSPKLGDAAPGGKKRGPRDKCVVCVGRDGVRVLSTDRLRTLGVLAARRIARWVPRPCTDGDGDDGKGSSELVFEWAPPSEGDDAARVRCVFRLQGRDAARDCCALLDDYGTLDAAPESNGEPGARRAGDAAARVDVEPLDAVVLDSPYSDIHQLAVDLASTRLIGGFSTPWVVTQAVLHFLETTILETAKFNISDLKPIDHVGDCATPALFLHAEDDSLVGISHMEALVRSYGGPRAGQQKRAKFPTSKAPISAVFHSPRVLAMVEGTHSSPRSKRTLDFVGKFLCKHMRITPDADFARNFALERVAPGPRLESDHHADAPAPN
ncbi:palmitoyl-(protein) hydrolase [Aureococcus anophagefferens]|nr:palmitoyl-(protein) hydrolase [Aureococcus anophagefferens]